MNIHIFGGGTFNHVRSHLALAAPAFGTTAKQLQFVIEHHHNRESSLELTAMAGGKMLTNDDVEARLDQLLDNPYTSVIIFNVALCDYTGHIVDPFDPNNKTPSGKYETRLKTSEGKQTLSLEPANKLISKIRFKRPDIFVVGFKTTCGGTSADQIKAACNMINISNVNLVLANDTKTRNNIIVNPSGNYKSFLDREEAIIELSNTMFETIKEINGEY